jgi:FkbM family methyltransferase
MLSYAQNFEDVYIYRAFREVPNGFYIDIGAYDPVDDSVTKLFYDRGWSGINVEPGPIFENLVKERKNDINLRVLVTDRIGETDFYLHEGEPGTSTTASILDPGLVDRVPDRHRLRVATTTLPQLIEDYAPHKHVHFLKLDVEGCEEVIIRSTDWRRYRPELLIIEATAPYSHNRRDAAWNGVLFEAGYSLVFFDGINTYYLREESLHRKDAFDFPVNALDGFRKYEFDVEPRLEKLSERAAILTSEREILIHRLWMPAAPRSLKIALGMARALRAAYAIASFHWLDERLRQTVALTRAWRKLAPGLRQTKPPRAPSPLARNIEEALLTLHLRGDGKHPQFGAGGRSKLRSARAVETALMNLALRKK